MTLYSTNQRKIKRPASLSSSSISRCPVTLEHVLGFTSTSNSAIDQNNSTIAYAAGCTVILYDKNRLKQDFIISTARKTITSLSLSSDGKYLATGECGHDPKVRIWDLAGDRKSCIELGEHNFAIDSVCFSPKAGRLVSIGSMHDGNIYVWNWQEKKKFASNRCLVSIRRIAFAGDGSYFVTVGNRHVKFWYFVSKKMANALPLSGHEVILGEHKNNIFTDVVCGRGSSASLTYVITTNGLICQFDEHRKLRAHRHLKKVANCLSISDSYLVVGCEKGVADVFSLQTLEPIMSMPLPHCLGVDTGFFASTDQTKNSQQQDISFPNVIAAHLDEAKSLASRLLTCFYNDHSFYIWDIKNQQTIERRDAHMYHSGCGWAIEICSQKIQTSSNLHELAFVTCSTDNTVRFWSLNQAEANLNIASSQVDNTVGGQLMKVIYLDKDCLKLCDNPKVQESTEPVPKVGGRCMKMAPDGLSLAIGDLSGNIRIFDMQTFKQTAFIEAHNSEVLSIGYGRSIDMNLTFLASSGRDRLVHLFDASKNYELIKTFDDHTGAVTAVRFTFSSSPSSLGLISCSADRSLIFRSISRNDNGKYQFLRLHSGSERNTFYDLAVDHQQNLIHTACHDRIIRVYNTQNGIRLRECKVSTSDNSGYIIKVDIDASGRYLATSCSNKYVYLWDTKKLECIASLCGPSEVVTDLKFSHDGHYLYTIASDSCIFVWNIRELASSSSSCRFLSDSSPKTDDLELTKDSETMSQVLNVIQTHPLETDCQQCESNITDVFNEDSSDTMIYTKEEDETDLLNEDDDITSTNTDSSIERANLLFIENDDLNYPIIDISVDDVVSKRLQFQRQNSLSSRFCQQSKETASPNILPISVNKTEDNLLTVVQIDDIKLLESSVPVLSIDSETCETVPDSTKMKPINVDSSQSVADLTINDTTQGDPSLTDDRTSIVNRLANDISKCLNELEMLYATITQSLDTRDQLLKQSIQQLYCDLHTRITNNQQQQ